MYIDESLRYVSAIWIDSEDPKRVRRPQEGYSKELPQSN